MGSIPSIAFPTWQPFDPFSEASFSLLSIKTVFLVDLALARRVSELSAISGLPGMFAGSGIDLLLRALSQRSLFISMKSERSLDLKPTA